jgi:hypothetical protein
MKRFGLLLFCTFGLSACRLPPEQAPLRPLPEEGQVYSYPEIFSRARSQATMALEAFYVDNWNDMEEAARGLEQSARFLPKTSDIPAKHKEQLLVQTSGMIKDALRLRLAAQSKDVTQANESLQRLHFTIRSLRPDPTPPSEASLEKKQNPSKPQ